MRGFPERFPEVGATLGIVLKGGNVVELEPAAVERVDLRIEDARIVARGPDLQPQPDDEVVALSGKLVFPGLVSAHHPATGDPKS